MPFSSKEDKSFFTYPFSLKKQARVRGDFIFEDSQSMKLVIQILQVLHTNSREE
jgi:hypothetical protein